MFHVERKEPPHILARPKDHLVSGLTFEVQLDQEKQIAKTPALPSRGGAAELLSVRRIYLARKQKKHILRLDLQMGSNVNVFQKRAVDQQTS